MRIVGSVLVRNEDVFVEQAIRNAAVVCDRIHAVDHMSTDRTWEILQRLALEFDTLGVRRARHARASHEVLEPYFGTDTWVLRIDGDELYDPARLRELRAALVSGAHQDVFRIQGNVLHVVRLDENNTAHGYLSPPSRPISALYNLRVVTSWRGSLERLHGGEPAFVSGYSWKTVDPLYQRVDWDESPLRCLHVCFVRRSSQDVGDGPRANLGELDAYRRSPLGTAERVARRWLRRPVGSSAQVAMRAQGASWKEAKYRRGECVAIDATPFLGHT